MWVFFCLKVIRRMSIFNLFLLFIRVWFICIVWDLRIFIM